MRIAIVSVNYDDASRIGSVRPRNVARWLASFGHEVVVITREVAPYATKWPDVVGVDVMRLPRTALMRLADRVARRGLEYIRRRRGRTLPSPLPRPSVAPGAGTRSDTMARVVAVGSIIYNLIDDLLWVCKWARSVKADTQVDVVWSTYGPWGSVFLGYALRRVAGVSIVDFRDPPATGNHGPGANWLLRNLQLRILSAADGVTTVSQGLRDMLTEQAGRRITAEFEVVRNGYEPADLPALASYVGEQGKFLIGYTGIMYEGKSDASALFQALKSLNEEGAVDLVNVEVHYAGRDSGMFIEQADRYDLGHIVVDHGLVDKAAAFRLQKACDLLLVLSWNTTRTRGVLTGKVYDYLGARRQILALTSGSLLGAELSGLIREVDAGYAFEYADADGQRPGLLRFLSDAYDTKIRLGVQTELRSMQVREFQYEHLVRQVERFMLRLMSDTLREGGGAGRP